MDATPRVAIWLPRVSMKPNRVRILVPTEDARRLGSWFYHQGIAAEFERHTAGGVWTVSRSRFRKVADALADLYGSIAVMQDFTEATRCTRACQFARSDSSLCECSCLGSKHGAEGGAAHDWSDGTLYVYHDFTRRCWVLEGRTTPIKEAS
jgi:hypothetical protein